MTNERANFTVVLNFYSKIFDFKMFAIAHKNKWNKTNSIA